MGKLLVPGRWEDNADHSKGPSWGWSTDCKGRTVYGPSYKSVPSFVITHFLFLKVVVNPFRLVLLTDNKKHSNAKKCRKYWELHLHIHFQLWLETTHHCVHMFHLLLSFPFSHCSQISYYTLPNGTYQRWCGSMHGIERCKRSARRVDWVYHVFHNANILRNCEIQPIWLTSTWVYFVSKGRYFLSLLPQGLLQNEGVCRRSFKARTQQPSAVGPSQPHFCIFTVETISTGVLKRWDHEWLVTILERAKDIARSTSHIILYFGALLYLNLRTFPKPKNDGLVVVPHTSKDKKRFSGQGRITWKISMEISLQWQSLQWPADHFQAASTIYIC